MSRSGIAPTFRLLLTFATDRLGRHPTDLLVTDIDADLVGRFLDFVETSRGNSARSRNTRLAAIRSFFSTSGVSDSFIARTLVPTAAYLFMSGL